METKKRLEKIGLIIITILFGIVILRSAATVYHYDETIPRGILGIAILYFIIRDTFGSHSDEAIDVLLDFPKNIKYILLMVFYLLLVRWALEETYRLVLFFLN